VIDEPALRGQTSRLTRALARRSLLSSPLRARCSRAGRRTRTWTPRTRSWGAQQERPRCSRGLFRVYGL